MSEEHPEASAPGHVHSFIPTEPAPGPERPARNATRQAWLDYSIARRVTVDAEATRDEIIAAVEEADQQ